MNIHKYFKILYLLPLAIYSSYTYSMDLPLENEDAIFPIQTYPSNLQSIVFENMLSQLNTYKTTFFEDNQIQDKEEIKKIGVLRYQIACFMLKKLLTNSIEPEKLESIPNSLTTIKDILYHNAVFFPYIEKSEPNESECFKRALKYKPVTDIIDMDITIPDIISDMLKTNKKTIFENIQNKNFNFPKRQYLIKIIHNLDLEGNIIIIPGRIPSCVIITTIGISICSFAIPLGYLLSTLSY